jgi:hypothetical protein
MRRIAMVIAILVIAIGILAAAHAYVATRLVLDPGLDASARSVLLWVIGMLGIGMVLQPVAERFYRPPALRWLSWIPLLWMGFLLLAVVMLGSCSGSPMACSGSWERDPPRVRREFVPSVSSEWSPWRPPSVCARRWRFPPCGASR